MKLLLCVAIEKRCIDLMNRPICIFPSPYLPALDERSEAPAEMRLERWDGLRAFCWLAVTELAWAVEKADSWASVKACQKLK